VPQLNEESNPNTRRLKPPARRQEVADGRTLVHVVQHPLTAALRTKPGFGAAGVLELLSHAFAHQVGAGLDGEGNAAAGRFDSCRECAYPIGTESEDVVRKPHMMRMEVALE